MLFSSQQLTTQQVTTTTTTMLRCMKHLGGGNKSSAAKARTFHDARSMQKMTDLAQRKFADNSEKKLKWVMGLYAQW